VQAVHAKMVHIVSRQIVVLVLASTSTVVGVAMYVHSILLLLARTRLCQSDAGMIGFSDDIC
jgi:hypothetical protein